MIDNFLANENNFSSDLSENDAKRIASSHFLLKIPKSPGRFVKRVKDGKMKINGSRMEELFCEK